MPTLVIQHTEGSKPPEFTVIRQVPLQTTPNAACITAPELFEVPQLSNTNLRRELRWYLEQFLDYPFEPNL